MHASTFTRFSRPPNAAISCSALLSVGAATAERAVTDELDRRRPVDLIVGVRQGEVPAAARAPELGGEFLAFLMSPDGQRLLSHTLRLSAVSLEVAGQTSPAGGMGELDGLRLKPVPVSPGLLAYLDQATRAKLLARWNKAIQGR